MRYTSSRKHRAILALVCRSAGYFDLGTVNWLLYQIPSPRVYCRDTGKTLRSMPQATLYPIRRPYQDGKDTQKSI
jgi:hypothetical protein